MEGVGAGSLLTRGPGGDPMRPSTSVPRARLLARLRSASDATVVVVTGQAGAGKSTLAAQWARLDPRPHAHVRLGEQHDDPVSLAMALIDALPDAGPPPDLPALLTASEPRLSTVVLPGLGSLAGSRTVPHVLVLDDLHLIRRADSQRMLQAYCARVPEGSQVLLLSRAAPPAWTARLRAEGRLAEIAPRELAFDEDEGEQLLRGMGLRLDRSATTGLVDWSEGWAVALHLAGMAMAQEGDRTAAAGRGFPGGTPGGQFVSDYLRGEVLAGLDEESLGFLLRTSILTELEAGACDAVRAAHDSARLLAGLHERLHLIIPLDPQRERFRYHHLLADALQAGLRRHRPEEIPVLHQRAAWWYAHQGDLDAAIRHAKAAGDHDLLAELIWLDIAGTVGADRPDRLLRWLDGLSEQQVARNPWLSLATAWSALQGADHARMNRWLLQCEAHAGADWRQRAQHERFPAELAALMMIVGRGGLDDSLQLARAALSGLPPTSPFRAPAAFICGVALTLRRDPLAGEQSLLEAGRISRALGVPLVEADAFAWRGLLAILAGDVDGGASLILQGVGLVRRHNLARLATAAHCITAQALALALRGDKDAAATLATARRLTLGVEDIAPWFHVCGRLIQARTAALLGDGATARLLVREARHLMTPELKATLAQDLLDDTEQAIQRLAESTAPGVALTSAELRVLQFMPSHLSFPEIGEHMFLSRNTVKTHALSIYRKLGVTSRSEAVAAAQRLGLVEAGGIG